MYVKYYDAKAHVFKTGEFELTDRKYTIKPMVKDKNPDYYITPGWIDMHTHIYDGVGIFGVEADRIGCRAGTCMVVDAGTVGEYTLQGFRKYVMPTIRTNFKLFLCVSPIGVIFHHEYNAMEYLNVERTVKAIEENRDIIAGIKVRIGSEVIRHEGIEPLRIASEIARRVNLPMMVHIGGVPPTLEDMEPYIMKGDIITHCFNGRGFGVWDEDGTTGSAMKRLIDKGVILDIGHGGGSFSFEIFEKAIKHPLPRFTCGTDLHSQSVREYALDLSTLLTKVWGSGISLEDTIWGVTTGPSEILKLDDWCNMDGYLQNATIFEIFDNAKREYSDCHGNKRTYPKGIRAIANILNGNLITVMPNNPFATYINV